MQLSHERPVILTVDDDPVMLTFISRALKSEFRVKIATNAAKALEIATRDDRLDLILLDAILPDAQGRDLCLQLENSERASQIPIVFVSGNSASEPLSYYGKQVVGWLNKPVAVDTLFNVIRRALG